MDRETLVKRTREEFLERFKLDLKEIQFAFIENTYMIEEMKEFLEPKALAENLLNLQKLKEFCLSPFRKSFKCVDLNEEFVAMSENTFYRTEIENTLEKLALYDTQQASLS